MDVAQMQALLDSWWTDFSGRLPARVRATGEVRVHLLELLYLIDGMVKQRFALAPDGQLVFRLSNVAQALGTSRRAALSNALSSSLAGHHVTWQRFDKDGPTEPALTLGGVVLLTALISPWRFRSRDRQRWQQQRHALALQIIRAMPADEPDVGAQINNLVEPAPALH